MGGSTDMRRACEAGYTPGGTSAEVHFIIRIYGNGELSGTATVITTRAGILPEKEFTIR